MENLSNKVCDQITNFVEVSQKQQSALGLTKKSPSKPGYNLRVFFNFSIEKKHKILQVNSEFFLIKKPRLLNKQQKEKEKVPLRSKEQEEKQTNKK